MRNAIDDDWYRKQRLDVEAIFVEANLTAGSEEVHLSPTGRYRLVVNEYRDYTRGKAYAGDRIVADVKRSYYPFYFAWAEGHSNGHDYLVCGEDHQGQTVIELDTSRRADFISESAKDEDGFYFCRFYPSPDRKMLVIDGCYWACPYELVFCRFDDPMALPWPEIDRAIQMGEPTGWTDEGFVYESSEEIRITDLKRWDELPATEQRELRRATNEIGGQRLRRWRRSSDGSKVLLEERVVRNADTGRTSDVVDKEPFMTDAEGVGDDDLRYGFVLTRLHKERMWWHGHLVRSNLRYQCELLGRSTTMLFLVQKMGTGGLCQSKRFILTLDGEGIDETIGVKSTGDWGEVTGTEREKADALKVRQTVVPLLHDDRDFQRAIWFIVKHLEYETVADMEQMRRLDVPPFEAE